MATTSASHPPLLEAIANVTHPGVNTALRTFFTQRSPAGKRPFKV